MPLPVTCPACGKSFSISDESYDQKIKGRIVSVKCKQCQKPIRVDGTKPLPARDEGREGPDPSIAPPAEAAAAVPAAPVPAAPVPAAVAAPIAAEAQAPGATESAPSPSALSPSPPRVEEASPRAQAAAVAAAPAVFQPSPPTPAPPPATRVGLGTPRVPPVAPLEPPAAAPVPPRQETRAVAAAPPGGTLNGLTPAAALANAPEPPPRVEEPLFAVDSPEGDRELTVEQIGREIGAGTITPETLVWRDGMAEWEEVKKVAEFARFLKKPNPAKAAPLPPRAPAPAGRFRPRQPTLPMGALPDHAGADAAPPVGTQDFRATQRLGSRVKLVEPVPVAVPADEEPTVLRSPEAVAALLSAAAEALDEPPPIPREERHTPVPPRLAHRLPGTEAVPPGAARGGLGARTELGLGVVTSAKSTFDRVTPPPGLPLPGAETRSSGSGPKVSPVDTFRESPEAKRAWFPEPVPGASSPFNPEPSRPVSLSGERQEPVAAEPPPPPPPPPPFSNRPSAPLVAAAPLTAPSLQAPRVGAPSASSPTHAGVSVADVGSRPQRGKALWVVLALALLAAGGAAYAYFGGALLGGTPKQAPPPAAPAPEATAAPTSPTATPEPSAPEGDASASPAPEVASLPGPQGDAAVPAPTAAASQRDPLAEPTAAPGTNGFADLFAEGAKRASSGRFEPALGKAAFDALLTEVARCRESGGPTGLTRVTVTFAPTGAASNVTVNDAPFAGTSTGACITSVFKRARVQPFTGSPGTIVERVSLQ